MMAYPPVDLFGLMPYHGHGCGAGDAGTFQVTYGGAAEIVELETTFQISVRDRLRATQVVGTRTPKLYGPIYVLLADNQTRETKVK